EVSSSTGAPAPAPIAPSAAPAPSAALAAKTAPASTAQAGVMVASNMLARAEGKKKLAPPTRWMLSKDGALLRSTDAGKNWQAVPFAGNVTFRAIAVIGPKVWVAGQGGALYYSPDDGNQWQSLTPSANGAALTEDITGLTFSDAQHGNLTTASGQTWTTSDGGRSWQKQ
ncbi:MAG TPA: YCF48-related protein, partial [Terriglobales bacterium]|nr:YCF48-related protein [Terriglobales bacterium]